MTFQKPLRNNQSFFLINDIVVCFSWCWRRGDCMGQQFFAFFSGTWEAYNYPQAPNQSNKTAARYEADWIADWMVREPSCIHIWDGISTARLLRLPRLRNRLGNRPRWIKTLNVVSSVLWRVQYKHETPNQSLKFKTLNVACSTCSQVQWDHETPNQSLNLKP